MRVGHARTGGGRREFARFLALGPVGVVLGGAQFELLWALNPLQEWRPASTWLVSNVLGIAWMHALHCRLTFSRREPGVWRRTLPRAYAIYAATILAGALGMEVLLRMGIDRRLAWLGLTMAGSLANFALLRRLMLATGRKGTSDAHLGSHGGRAHEERGDQHPALFGLDSAGHPAGGRGCE